MSLRKRRTSLVLVDEMAAYAPTEAPIHLEPRPSAATYIQMGRRFGKSEMLRRAILDASRSEVPVHVSMGAAVERKVCKDCPPPSKTPRLPDREFMPFDEFAHLVGIRDLSSIRAAGRRIVPVRPRRQRVLTWPGDLLEGSLPVTWDDIVSRTLASLPRVEFPAPQPLGVHGEPWAPLPRAKTLTRFERVWFDER